MEESVLPLSEHSPDTDKEHESKSEYIVIAHIYEHNNVSVLEWEKKRINGSVSTYLALVDSL